MAMDADQEKILQKGREIFRLMEAEPPALFDRRHWLRELISHVAEDPDLKVRLFRFIDVFPALSPDSVAQHLKEYFPDREAHLPPFMKALLTGASFGPVAGISTDLLRRNIRLVSRNFIAGESPADALKALKHIWDSGRTFSVDILGEAALSEKEALHYLEFYLALIDLLTKTLPSWPARTPEREKLFPRLNISVKASSLYSRIGPLNYEDSVAQLKSRLRNIYRRGRDAGGFVNLDMEMYSLRSIIFDTFTELLDEPEFRRWTGAGIAVQAYLKETAGDVQRLATWARGSNRRITVRLVKGAYWEYETVMAAQKGWPTPVFDKKAHTDWNFERCAELLLANADCLTAAFGTHNVRSLAFALVTAEAYSVPAERFELQLLYGMAEPVKAALRAMGHMVREYTPAGELLPGMAYLVRRLLENSSNEGFLRKTFAAGVGQDILLAAPEPWPGEAAPLPRTDGNPFRNEPPLDFSIKTNRAACRVAVGKVRRELGRAYPVVIGGKEYQGTDVIASVNPARPDELIGRTFGVSREMIDLAVTTAAKAQRLWAKRSAPDRAGVLFRAAALTRERRLELLAWQVLETGKTWAEADADVTEAIDYLEYYGRQMLRIERSVRVKNVPGEENRYHYLPRGVSAVIAPWNFPLAISMGMAAAALVTGNAVLYKPSPRSSVNGWQVFSLLRDAGIPDGVLNFLPGRDDVLGNHLIGHPGIDLLAFTGSRKVGLAVIAETGAVAPGQRGIKHAIVEMGGKNAIIVDADADLDQAVSGVIQSTFSYQGQKCSACSRVIVLMGCYDRFMDRLSEAVRDIRVGPPEDPTYFMGPVIDGRARDSILAYVGTGRKEGKVAAEAAVPDGGFYVPPLVMTDLPADSRLLKEEIFGPVLVVLRVQDMEEALLRANETSYALTGGLYSRSPVNISRCLEVFSVGNLYINRPITGAIVGRQPFGGFRMSGLGSKAGGPDYLLQFMMPRVTTENTLRRGFTPEIIA
jgi:RHH-type transcriptional regulator, proline utilization regulon repressor / proline dehydrogenase / delta 1-pyrroline-5-carboxylate dehydrogenase